MLDLIKKELGQSFLRESYILDSHVSFKKPEVLGRTNSLLYFDTHREQGDLISKQQLKGDTQTGTKVISLAP
jgi:hypothetical protein